MGVLINFFSRILQTNSMGLRSELLAGQSKTFSSIFAFAMVPNLVGKVFCLCQEFCLSIVSTHGSRHHSTFAHPYYHQKFLLQLVLDPKSLPICPSRSIMHGRKRPFSFVFDPFHINRITAVFCRIVIECKRSDTAFSHRIRSFSTVYDTVKYGPYETGQIRTVYGHKRQYTRRISAYTVIVFIDLSSFPPLSLLTCSM